VRGSLRGLMPPAAAAWLEWKPSANRMLPLSLQIGPCRIEPVGRRLLRVRGGSDQPEVVAAIRRAGGVRDGTRQFWWLEASNLRTFADELRRVSDPLFQTR